ncbi:MAG TPA: ATP synthase F1 subunit gamma [Candidatus Saccharibacteria bacterium]|nr:ATP synthase F1 subunit gamma [Candidatus Saccharibacteria bacterium]
MASTQQLKRRITSVSNTKQITKAMELVAASKMRKAQDAAAKSRDFRNLANEILNRLRQLTDVDKHPLFRIRHVVKTRLHIVITSDRGLAGAYNSNVLRQLAKELKVDKEQKVKSEVIVVGKQAARFIARLDDIEVVAVYRDFPESPTANDIRPILNMITEKFEKKDIDLADILYTDFKSSIVQEVKYDRLLPVSYTHNPVGSDMDLAEFEPSPKAVLDNITVRLVEAQLSQAFLESQASEHSMRMMAMKNATDNANDLVDDLTLAFNTARQAGITQELAEITGGAEAIK